MRLGILVAMTLLALLACTGGVLALDRPMISDVFFYWYTWDKAKELGGWLGGVYYTPLVGYYDSPTYEDELRELWLASEWGMTEHFIDYWGGDWRDTEGKPREGIIFRAAETLQQEGYDVHVSYYQDGTNFEMHDFAANLDDGRDFYRGLAPYAQSPVWPTINGDPVWLVYGRNGSPRPSEDAAAFREYLRRQYTSVENLNKAWGTQLASFEEANLAPGASGRQSADSIRFIYSDWEQQMARFRERVRERTGLPGVRLSFDVGYWPFDGGGYSAFAKTFGGPHSYGGIFGQPEDQDVARFIQSVVAKWYGTAFFDHFKNEYHDWNTEGRTPGMEYSPDPANFDRFWVGALLRNSEALLHMSWNEWWEGSNMEPSVELGKKWAEKNLFYSTLMKMCFPSLRHYDEGAQMAVLLNDWAAPAGADDEEMEQTVQALRLLGVRFSLIPDEFVSAERLGRYQVVIAPSCGVGFGQNAEGEPVLEVLLRWARESGHTLLISDFPQAREQLRLETQSPPSAAAGGNLNLFVDVGADNDDDYLASGYSGREDWGELPPGKFGASEGRHTVRWTPGAGSQTVLMLPASPERDHLLRFAGDAIWDNEMEVRVEGAPVGTVGILPGRNEYEIAVPASAIGGRSMVEVRLVYAKARIPGELAPERFGGEARVCDLALDWLQWSTANMPRSTENVGHRRSLTIVPDLLAGSSDSRGAFAPTLEQWVPHVPLRLPEGARLLSHYDEDKAPREFLMGFGEGSILYVNGPISLDLPPRWLGYLLANGCGLRWQPPVRALGKDDRVIGSVLSAGSTKIVLAYNYGDEPAQIQVAPPHEDLPLSEQCVLAADGMGLVESGPPPAWAAGGSPQSLIDSESVGLRDRIGHYAVYQFAFAPVRVETESPLTVGVGGSLQVHASVENLTRQSVTVQLSFKATIPSITGTPVSVGLAPRERKGIVLPLWTSERVDWGIKSVLIEIKWDDGVAYLWRPLEVLPPPQINLATSVVDSADPQLALVSAPNPYMRPERAENTVVSVGGRDLRVGRLEAASPATVRLPLEDVPVDSPRLDTLKVTVRYETDSGPKAEEHEVAVARYPRGDAGEASEGQRRIFLFNPTVFPAERSVYSMPAAKDLPAGTYVVSENGRSAPAEVFEGRLYFPVAASPHSAQSLILQPSSNPTTDLVVKPLDLGTGRGRLIVSNDFYSCTLDEARGGVMTSFISKRTGLDYAADSFGAAVGQWSNPKAPMPAHNAADYIAEQKVFQRDSPQKVRLVHSGPALVVAEVQASLTPTRQAHQRYTFFAGADHFLLSSWLSCDERAAAEEFVLCDARLRAGSLTKIFPGFSGMEGTLGKEAVHAGFRQHAGPPPHLTTLFNHRDYSEAISLFPLAHDGVDRYRQGFWPAPRGKPGICEFAEVEYIGLKQSVQYGVSLLVQVHPGYHLQAKQAEECRNGLWAKLVP